jgi:hypothetical protein
MYGAHGQAWAGLHMPTRVRPATGSSPSRQQAGSPAPARTVVAAVLHCEADPGAAQAQQEPCQDGWVGGIHGIGGSRIAKDDGSGALAAGAVGSLGLSALEHLVTHALPAGRKGISRWQAGRVSADTSLLAGGSLGAAGLPLHSPCPVVLNRVPLHMCLLRARLPVPACLPAKPLRACLMVL